MSESNRIKLLELAIQGGATIENATKVATDWEQWATEGDPLRLDTPGPKWQHESEISESDYQRIHAGLHGIDWSRPQLVVSKLDDTMIVRTTGVHIDDVFAGYGPWDGDVLESNYKKRHFKYHGEIEEPNTTGLNFLEAIKLLTDEKVVTKRASWDEDAGHLYSDGSHLRDEEGDPYYGNSIENFLATDWQIVKS